MTWPLHFEYVHNNLWCISLAYSSVWRLAVWVKLNPHTLLFLLSTWNPCPFPTSTPWASSKPPWSSVLRAARLACPPQSWWLTMWPYPNTLSQPKSLTSCFFSNSGFQVCRKEQKTHQNARILPFRPTGQDREDPVVSSGLSGAKRWRPSSRTDRVSQWWHRPENEHTYIYLEPEWPLCWTTNHPFHMVFSYQNRGQMGSRYIYIYLYIIYINIWFYMFIVETN